MKKLTFTLISLLTAILLAGCLTANQWGDVMEKTLMQVSAEQKAERAQREERERLRGQEERIKALEKAVEDAKPVPVSLPLEPVPPWYPDPSCTLETISAACQQQ